MPLKTSSPLASCLGTKKWLQCLPGLLPGTQWQKPKLMAWMALWFICNPQFCVKLINEKKKIIRQKHNFVSALLERWGDPCLNMRKRVSVQRCTDRCMCVCYACVRVCAFLRKWIQCTQSITAVMLCVLTNSSNSETNPEFERIHRSVAKLHEKSQCLFFFF